MLADVNADRAKHGLAPVKESAALDTEAQNRSTDMVKRNYFNHLIPDQGSGHYFMQDLASAPQHYGENVAENSYTKQGMSDVQAMDQTEKDFMNSPEHRANVLNPNLTSIGFGAAYDSQGQMKLTQDYTN